MEILFGPHIQKSHFSSKLIVSSHDQHESRGEVFAPKHPGAGRRTWADVKYKGDWMKRPISNTEVAWLARLLIRLSDWLNEILGLDRYDERESENTGPTYVEVGQDTVRTVGGPKEALGMVVGLIISWAVLLGHSVLRYMRVHKMKVNLRVRASKKFVMVLVLYVVVSVLKRAAFGGFAIPGIM